MLVKIAVVKLRELHQLRFVEHVHPPLADIDDAVLAQLLDDAVGVHRRDPQGLADLLLGQRKFERSGVHVSGDLQPPAQLQHDVAEPGRCGPLSDVDDPFAEDRGIDQGVAPERVRYLMRS